MTHPIHYYEQSLLANKNPRALKTTDLTEKKLINFSSSDYLGLATHPTLIQQSGEYANRYGVGSRSSRLVCGNLPPFASIEKKLATALRQPTALILASGYQTNQSVLEALFNKKVLHGTALVFADKYCHTSMQNTARYFADLHRFQHNNLTHLEALLEKYKTSAQAKFILVESIYSMDGDQTDLATLTQLAKHYNVFLYVDDAHALGVYGDEGYGLAAPFATDIDITMGTFSKGLGSFGGFIACNEIVRDYLINQCKGLIYSTGIAPPILGAIEAAIDLIPQLSTQRKRLLQHATHLRDFFRKHHLPCGTSTTHIIPWIIGDSEKTLFVAKQLETQGILSVAIRPPSVPPKQSRIRFCITAEHTESDLELLMSAILKVEQLL